MWRNPKSLPAAPHANRRKRPTGPARLLRQCAPVIEDTIAAFLRCRRPDRPRPTAPHGTICGATAQRWRRTDPESRRVHAGVEHSLGIAVGAGIGTAIGAALSSRRQAEPQVASHAPGPATAAHPRHAVLNEPGARRAL